MTKNVISPGSFLFYIVRNSVFTNPDSQRKMGEINKK